MIGATILLGTGAGIAFFMVMADRTRDARLVAHTAGVVVVADVVFTASAIVLQPITGVALAAVEDQPLGQALDPAEPRALRRRRRLLAAGGLDAAAHA